MLYIYLPGLPFDVEYAVNTGLPVPNVFNIELVSVA